jgi:hypothetical protein
MADSKNQELQEKIKSQGEIVRKLKGEKAEKDKVCNCVTVLQNEMLDIDNIPS